MDIEHGAEQLQVLYDNPTLRKELGDTGFQKVKKIYDWDVVMPQWIELFENMAKK